MKILIAHNAYQQHGGEDMVVDAEIALLRRHGHEVECYLRHNDELKAMPRLRAAAGTVWSLRSARDLSATLRRFAPDVIHVHNTFPLISPALYWTAARHRVPVVQTLHNFRLLCPQAIFLREGRICEDCLGKSPWRAVGRKCYRDSAAQTAVLTGMLCAHRAIGTYRARVTRYIALTRFARDKYVQGGLPADRFRIKPNFIDAGPRPPLQTRCGGLYVGRLSHEKGLEVLVAAAHLLPRPALEIIGAGPLEPLVRAGFGPAWLGPRTLDEILARMERARFLVLPSICHENAPRTIVEAYSRGLPIIASRLGALADLIDDGRTGLLFEPGNPHDLAAKIAWAHSHPDDMARMGHAAREEYERHYTPQRNHELLIDIYEDAIADLQRQPCPA